MPRIMQVRTLYPRTYQLRNDERPTHLFLPLVLTWCRVSCATRAAAWVSACLWATAAMMITHWLSYLVQTYI
jgi:hypothetical protein